VPKNFNCLPDLTYRPIFQHPNLTTSFHLFHLSITITMASNIVPNITAEEVPILYFTVRVEDYPQVAEFLQRYDLSYGRFFASFINYGKVYSLKLCISFH
jgi:hypothetical protein